jgi:hypothetical protein
MPGPIRSRVLRTIEEFSGAGAAISRMVDEMPTLASTRFTLLRTLPAIHAQG